MKENMQYLARCFQRIFVPSWMASCKKDLVPYGKIYSTCTKCFIELSIDPVLPFSRGSGIYLDMADHRGRR